MENEPTVNIDEFINKFSLSVGSLPTRDLELCDIANEIGIVIAELVGTRSTLETEVIASIRHGFDLVRIRSNESEEDGGLKERLDTESSEKSDSSFCSSLCYLNATI